MKSRSTLILLKLTFRASTDGWNSSINECQVLSI
jgi:hypothetical protein